MSSRVVLRRHPEAQHLGAVLRDQLLGRDVVALRLRHLAPVAVDHEAVGEHRAVGRLVARAHPPRAARSGTSRGAGRSPRGTSRPASAARAAVSSTAAWLHPESNHTSRMSVSLRKLGPAALRALGARGQEILRRRARATRRRPCPSRMMSATCSTSRSSSEERRRTPCSRRPRSARPRRAGAR